MRDYGLDGGDSAVSTPDLQLNSASATTAASITSKDSYSITIENLPVKLTGKYNFVFQYYYQNPDKTQTTPILGPTSATYSISPTIQDLSTAPTNVVATGGFYSYQLKWDTPTFLSYGDTIVYESNTNSFNASSKVVYVGTANQCTILTSDLLPKYVYVVHRDMFLDANKKGTVAGPITIQDPITVDANPPSNTFTVGTTTVQDDPDGLFTFNKKILFTWTENADATTYGYQIRFRRLGTTDYTYMSAPGKATTSTYLYGVKAGQTYEVAVTTYDQFGNINTSDWKSYPNIVIPASTSLAADVAITAGDMKMGYGIGGDNANKGLYLGPENYWYIQGNTTASSAARLSVGGATDKLLWDGTSLAITGNLTARTGSFTGNILLASTNASIYNGTINAAGNLTGNGFALNATGLKVANGTNSITLDATNGQITANAGSIGGWQLTSSGLSNNNARLNSTLGTLELGGYNTDDIVHLDANDANYRLWIGRNSSATAPFKVSKEGVLTASGATITGNSTFSGTVTIGSQLSDGTSLQLVKDNATTGAGLAPTVSSHTGTLSSHTATLSDHTTTLATHTQSLADQAATLSLAVTSANVNTVLAANTTVINGSRITTGTVDLAYLNIAGGSPTSNGFKIDATGIRAYNGYNRTLEINSDGTISLGDSTYGWTVDNRYITSRSYYTTGYSKIVLDGWNGSITGGRIAGTTLEGNTITGGTIVGSKVQTSTSANRVQMVDSTTDSLQVVYGSAVRGHVLAAASAGILMHYGTTANANATTYGLLLLGNGSATLAADSNNYFLVNTTSTTISGEVSTVNGGFTFNSGGHTYFQKTSTGATTPSTTTSNANAYLNSSTGQLARSTSSRRYKTNIESISVSDDSIKLLNPVKFQGISDIQNGDETYKIGLIAEEVAAIPELELLVNYNEDGSPEALAYERLAVVLTNTIKRILNRLDAAGI
jgi:hypothetical protein